MKDYAPENRESTKEYIAEKKRAMFPEVTQCDDEFLALAHCRGPKKYGIAYADFEIQGPEIKIQWPEDAYKIKVIYRRSVTDSRGTAYKTDWNKYSNWLYNENRVTEDMYVDFNGDQRYYDDYEFVGSAEDILEAKYGVSLISLDNLKSITGIRRVSTHYMLKLSTNYAFAESNMILNADPDSFGYIEFEWPERFFKAQLLYELKLIDSNDLLYTSNAITDDVDYINKKLIEDCPVGWPPITMGQMLINTDKHSKSRIPVPESSIPRNLV
ncbi:MAG: hypothetical protein PHS31_08170 [Victivallaceae bacterium]|nr:hypothetical protein [Victivallaceae bacterium]